MIVLRQGFFADRQLRLISSCRATFFIFFIFCTSNSDVVYAKFLGFFTNFAACLRPFMNLRRLPS